MIILTVPSWADDGDDSKETVLTGQAGPGEGDSLGDQGPAPPEYGDTAFGRLKKRTRKKTAIRSSSIRIKGIKLEGCDKVPRRTVKSILRQKRTPWYRRNPKEGEAYDVFWAQDDRRRIEKFYQSKGFYDAVVSEPEVVFQNDGKAARLIYRIQENDPILVSSVEIIFEDGVYHDKDPKITRDLVEFKQGDRFELEPYQDAAAAIRTYYQNEAFYNARVERSALITPRVESDPETGKAKVTYRITKGERFFLGQVTVEGTEKTRPKVVEKALGLQSGQKYRMNKIIEAQRRVSRLPIYSSVRLEEEADPVTKQIDLTVKVKEGKPRLYKVGVGYGSEEGVRVMGSWRHVNFLGGARELSTSARYSVLWEQEKISFLQPNVLRPGSYINLTGEHNVHWEESYTHESISLSPAYHFILTNYLWAEVSYKIEDNKISDVQNRLDITADDLAKEGLLSAFAGKIEWADLDDPINPKEGARASLFAEYGGGPVGGDFNYIKLIGEARGYYPLNNLVTGKAREKMPFEWEVVAAARGSVGWSEPLGDTDSIPIFKRFYAGGASSVRGFARHAVGPLDGTGDPLGGSKSWEGSFELRFPIWNEFGGVVFSDSGWVWTEEENYDLNDLVYSYGFGLRYDTPIGPIGLDFGFPINDEPGLAKQVFSLNIGNAF